MFATHSLYLVFGVASMIPFTLRFLIQWLLSERKQKSYVTPLFWKLSVIGDLLLLLHYLLQMQYHLYFTRFATTYFAFRQLRLLRGNAPPFSIKRYLRITLVWGGFLTLLFLLLSFLRYDKIIWIQTPRSHPDRVISSFWHAIGFSGAFLFTSRLWVQWWQSEKKQESRLGPAFWKMSLFGGTLTLLYAIRIRDPITAFGYGAGLIPYLRNLMLLKKEKKRETL